MGDKILVVVSGTTQIKKSTVDIDNIEAVVAWDNVVMDEDGNIVVDENFNLVVDE